MVRVCETRPGLSIPSRNSNRGVKADSDCRLCQLCAIDTDNSINVSLWSKETFYSAKKKQVQRHKCQYLKRVIYSSNTMPTPSILVLPRRVNNS